MLNTRIGSLDGDKLSLLRGIVEATDCRIILASSWRKTERQLLRIAGALTDYGMRLHDTTPILEQTVRGLIHAAPRWEEIQDSIDRHCPDTFAILDDEPDFGPLAAHHVRTDTATGLTPAIAQETIRLLKTP